MIITGPDDRDTDVAAVLGLVAASVAADGTHPVSEQALLQLQAGTGTDLLARDGDILLGYAHLDGTGAELVVHPAHRRQGVGGALLDRLEQLAPAGRLVAWAHGRLAAAVAFATSRGYVQDRVLLQLRRPLAGLPAGPELPAGLRLRAFAVGADEPAWLAVNARAFADHPEQGRWTIEDLRAREAQPWFDPAGFLIAERVADGAIVGFHWTKVHQDETPPVGEVYVIGIDPAAQGGGLGKALTLAGLRHLRGAGLATVLLYTDESNTGAVRMYEHLGFQRWQEDVQFRRDAPA